MGIFPKKGPMSLHFRHIIYIFNIKRLTKLQVKWYVVIGAEGMLKCFNKITFINFITTDVK